MDTMKQGLWLRWMPTFMGFIAGGEIAILVVGRMDSIAATSAGGALAGAIIGGGQWLALRGWLPVAGSWIAATAVGQALGLTVGAALVGYGTEPTQLAVQGAVTGLAVGMMQAMVLRRHNSGGRWWAMATSPIWAVGWLATWGFGIDVERQYTNFGLAGALVATVLSGLILKQLLQGQAAGESATPIAEGASI